MPQTVLAVFVIVITQGGVSCGGGCFSLCGGGGGGGNRVAAAKASGGAGDDFGESSEDLAAKYGKHPMNDLGVA